MSDIGQVAKATWLARGVAEAAIAEVMSMRSQVAGKIEDLPAYAEETTSRPVSKMAGYVRTVAAQVEESTSRVVGAVAQRLESEIEVMTGTAMGTMRNMRVAVDELRSEV